MARPSKQASTSCALASFGEAVRAARLEQEISQEALADLAGLDRSYMGGIERGEHNVALINIQKVAAALGVSIAELMTQAGI
jgi:transcriptional regulator with XRE-family HTH domain